MTAQLVAKDEDVHRLSTHVSALEQARKDALELASRRALVDKLLQSELFPSTRRSSPRATSSSHATTSRPRPREGGPQQAGPMQGARPMPGQANVAALPPIQEAEEKKRPGAWRSWGMLRARAGRAR